VLPSNYKNDYIFNMSDVYTQIRAQYPSSSLQLIKPLSFYVPDRQDLAWTVHFSQNNVAFNLSVKQDGNSPVYVDIE